MYPTFRFALMLLALVGVVALAACTSDNEDDENPQPEPDECGIAATDTLTYKADIEPIITNSCLPGCHNAANARAGLVIETYDQLRTAALDDNKILKSVKGEGGYERMPLTGSALDDCDIARLENWVNTGLKKE